jgi:hypothetical protein
VMNHAEGIDLYIGGQFGIGMYVSMWMNHFYQVGRSAVHCKAYFLVVVTIVF